MCAELYGMELRAIAASRTFYKLRLPVCSTFLFTLEVTGPLHRDVLSKFGQKVELPLTITPLLILGLCSSEGLPAQNGAGFPERILQFLHVDFARRDTLGVR